MHACAWCVQCVVRACCALGARACCVRARCPRSCGGGAAVAFAPGVGVPSARERGAEPRQAACASPAGSEPLRSPGVTAKKGSRRLSVPRGGPSWRARTWRAARAHKRAPGAPRPRVPGGSPAAAAPPPRERPALPPPLLGAGPPEPRSWAGRCPGRTRAARGGPLLPGRTMRPLSARARGGWGAWSRIRAAALRPPGRRLSGGARVTRPASACGGTSGGARARVQGCRLRGSSTLPAGPTVRRPGSRRRLRAWAPGPRFLLPSLPCAPRGSVAAGPRRGRWVGASGAAGGEPPAPRLCPHGAPAFLRICPALPGIKRWRLNSLCIRGSWAPSSCPTPRVQHTPQHRHFLQEMETLGFVVKVHPWEEGADRGQWLL